MTDQHQPPPPGPPAPQTVVNVNMTNTNQAIATAAPPAPAPRPPAAPVSTRTAYSLFALGGLGVLGFHRFYLGRPVRLWLFSFFALGALPILGFAAGDATAAIALSGGVPVLLVLLILDLFRIPRWVRDHNALLEQSPAGPALGAGAPVVLSGAQVPHTPPPAPSQPPVNAGGSEKPQDLRIRLLHAAHRSDGRLTVTQAVMETGETFKKVEACLRKMVRTGYVDVDNEPESGVIVYVFPELVGRPRPDVSPSANRPSASS